MLAFWQAIAFFLSLDETAVVIMFEEALGSGLKVVGWKKLAGWPLGHFDLQSFQKLA